MMNLEPLAAAMGGEIDTFRGRRFTGSRFNGWLLSLETSHPVPDDVAICELPDVPGFLVADISRTADQAVDILLIEDPR